MLPAPDRRRHGERLRELLHRYRAQEQVLRELLEQQQDQLEETDRQHCHNLLEPIGPGVPAREEALQTACEELATELLHVRMAVIGTAEELALHEDRRPALPLVAAS
ncbi:MAG: hypothetical protein ACK501_13070 [Planctomycetota bacterium]|jgi:hypothetical protein